MSVLEAHWMQNVGIDIADKRKLYERCAGTAEFVGL
jgi:hypothetical protein